MFENEFIVNDICHMPPMWVGMRLLNLRYELVLGSLTCLNGFGLIYKTPSYYLEDSQFSMDRLVYIYHICSEAPCRVGSPCPD